MNATSAAPVRKVTATVLAGAIVTILVWAVHQFANVSVPPEVAAALVTVVSFLVGYFVPAASTDYAVPSATGKR